MWQVVNRTSYAVERCFSRDRNGAEVWVVVVKATFDVGVDGSVRPALEQVPVYAVPVFTGEPGRSSLRYDTDLNLTKLGTDVVVHGHAYAPRGRPVTHMNVVLEAGPIRKMLSVVGNRIWHKGVVGLSISAAEPFVEMPLRYERAFGGQDDLDMEPRGVEQRNPVGIGFSTNVGRLAGRPLPNLEDPHHPIESPRARPTPAGLGPICASWSPRIELAGTYNQHWREERHPLLPLDFCDSYHQCAPIDQQVAGYLREGTEVRLRGMSPEGTFAFRLPAVRPTFRTFFGRKMVVHRARLHTVVVEPDHARVLVAWHTALTCNDTECRLDKTVVELKRYVGGTSEE